jgi:hypothetical protein
LDYEHGVLSVLLADGSVREFDMSGITGWADTISGTSFSFEID